MTFAQASCLRTGSGSGRQAYPSGSGVLIILAAFAKRKADAISSTETTLLLETRTTEVRRAFAILQGHLLERRGTLKEGEETSVSKRKREQLVREARQPDEGLVTAGAPTYVSEEPKSLLSRRVFDPQGIL